MGTCAHLPIFLDDEEEKVLVCTMVLPPPSARKGKRRSRVKAWAGHQEMGGGCGRDGGSHTQRTECDNWTERYTDESMEREFEEKPEEAGRQVGTGRR